MIYEDETVIIKIRFVYAYGPVITVKITKLCFAAVPDPVQARHTTPYDKEYPGYATAPHRHACWGDIHAPRRHLP